MSEPWTPEELTAASAAMKAAGHMSYEELCAAPRLRLEYRGRDSWDRPVYECDGRLYVDVDPRRSRPSPRERSLSSFPSEIHGLSEKPDAHQRRKRPLAAVGELQHALCAAGV